MTTTETGSYEPATSLRRGQQIRFLPTDDTGPVEWHTITAALYILAPAEFVRVEFADRPGVDFPVNSEVFCRPAPLPA